MPRIWRTTGKLLREWNELKPILSILVIVSTLLGLVFLQMEERRLGYSILKTSRSYKAKVDERRALEIRLAQATRLEKLESMALSRLTLKRAQSHQVIYLNDAGELEAASELRANTPANPPRKKRSEKSVRSPANELKVSALTRNPSEGARP